MRKSRPRSLASLETPASPSQWWKNLAVPVLPVLACFLGGATEKWSEAIVVALLGLLLLADPPRLSLGKMAHGILLALLACAAIAFLPASWFFQPAWRSALTNDFGIQLPATLSPQPWVTLGCLGSFVAGLSWLFYVSAQPLELRAARLQLRLFAGGVVALAVVCLFLYHAKSALPFWHNQRGFGPFPNRNQTGNLFGLAAIVVLACGQDDIRKGKKRWIAWLLALGLIVAAIVLNFSRAGLLILVAGSTFWLGGLVLRKGSTARIALGASALLMLLTALLLFGGQTLERFHLRGGDGAGLPPDFRWLIFRDALDLVRASPWCGIGLGNFEPVFAIFRDASQGNARALHPESDWLWLLAEMGWPAVLLAAAGLGVMIRRVFPLQEGTNQRFRLAAFIAASLFALHGLVDVSGHRAGTAFGGIFLLGLALRRPSALRKSSIIPIVFRCAGLALLGIGVAWLAAARYELPLPGSLGADNEKRLASSANRGSKFSETIVRTTRALEWKPLDWELYFLRALGKAAARRPSSALDDFRRARFLEPNSYEVPFEEGRLWLRSRPVLAITAWREALRRAGAQQAGVYSYMLAIAPLSNLEVKRGLEGLASGKPDLTLEFFGRLSDSELKPALERFLEQNPALQKLTGDQKTRLFAVWGDRGDRLALARAVQANPDWLSFAWRAIAKLRAGEQDFRAAFELAQRFGAWPTLPPVASGESLPRLQQSFAANPTNYALGFALYHEQMQQEQINDALITVRRITADPKCPNYFHFLEAQSWAAHGNWERAWVAWSRYREGVK